MLGQNYPCTGWQDYTPPQCLCASTRLYITLKVADAGFRELLQQAAHEELASKILRANKHAVLQQSHLVGSELHPLCNTATTGHSEGSHTTGHTLLWAVFNTLPLQSLALKRRSAGSVWAWAWWWWGGRSSCAGHGGAAGGTSGTLGHGEAPGLAHPVCTHQPRVFQYVCSFPGDSTSPIQSIYLP